MAAKAIQISCGNLEGYLYPSRFGPAGKSLCIKLDNKKESPWLTPIEFEKKSGKGAQHNWKRTVRSVTHGGKMMWHLIESGILNVCNDKHCQCPPCSISKVPATPENTTTKVEEHLQKCDTDSDSGISVEISTNASVQIHSEEPLTTQEQEKPLPNYTLMVQEAIMALTSGEKNKNANGCSLLGIFLYILKHFPMQESVSVMNVKIRSTLGLLKRMGIVHKITDDDTDDELEIESAFPKEEEIETSRQVPIPVRKPEVPTLSLKPEVPAKQPKKKIKANNKKLITNNKKLANKVEKKKKKKNSGKENCTFQSHPKKLSPALTAVCQGRKQMSRHDAVRFIWIYIKKHKLQDPKNKMVILCDDKLKAVTKKKKVTCTEVLTCLGQHMTAI